MNAKPMSNDVEAALSKGFWFFFEIDSHQVSIHNSALSGRERIWVDDELVANRISWRKTSQFLIDIDGRPVEITISIPSLMAGRVICTLRYKGQEIARSEKQLRQKKASPWALAFSVLLGMAIGYWSIRLLLSLFGAQ